MKRIILIGLLLLVNAAAIWFMYFRDQSLLKTVQPLENGLQMVQGNAMELKDLAPEIKRSMIYSGSLNIPPPCPQDTYEEDKFCRKGKFKGDTNIKFVGNKSIVIDGNCAPDECIGLCKNACETTAGEECWLMQDVFRSCLKDHPELAPAGNEGLEEAQASCMQEYSPKYEGLRCRFIVSRQDEPPSPDEPATKPVSFASCKKNFDEFQACMQKLKFDENNKASLVSYYEAMDICMNRYDKVFARSGCGSVYNKMDRRFTEATDYISCHVSCS